MAIISIRLSERDAALIRNYADIKRITISSLVRDTVTEKIEDEIDMHYFSEITKHLTNTVSYESMDNFLVHEENA